MNTLTKSTAIETHAAIPVLRNRAEIEHEIDKTIERLLRIAERRCCAIVKEAAHDFRSRRTQFDGFSYMDDAYLRTMAIEGAGHIGSIRCKRQLEEMFHIRDGQDMCIPSVIYT